MPGGDGNRNRARPGNAAATPAVRAGIGDADAFAAADGAGRAGHELTEDRLLGAADLAGAIARPSRWAASDRRACEIHRSSRTPRGG